MHDHPSVELLRDWFNRGQSGCKFASQLAAGEPQFGFFVHLGPVTTVDLDQLHDAFEIASAHDEVCLLAFPRVSSVREIIELARYLQTSSRWNVSSVQHPSDPSVLGLSITYKTQSGASSSAMGFAPSLTMPVTRRAPYTVLALWAGERKNEFFHHGPRGHVGLADVPTELSRPSYDKTWTASVAGTKKRLRDPLFDSAWLRQVAFCLPSDLIRPHWPT